MVLNALFRSNQTPAVAPAFTLTSSLKGVLFGVRLPHIDFHDRAPNHAFRMHRNKPKASFNCLISGSMPPISNEAVRRPEVPGRSESESSLHDALHDADDCDSLMNDLDAHLKRTGDMTPVETLAYAPRTRKEFNGFLIRFCQITGETVRYFRLSIRRTPDAQLRH